MFRIGILCYLGIYCIIGVSSLNCNRCIGPKNSDCANRVHSGMAVQACGSQPSESLHFIKYDAPDPSAEETNAIDSDLIKTEYSLAIAKNSRFWHRGKYVGSATASPFLDVYCVYLELSGAPEKVERRCGYVAPNQNVCAHIKQTQGNVKTCQACRTSLCN